MARAPIMPSAAPTALVRPAPTSGRATQLFWLWTTEGCHSPNYPKPGRMDGVHVASWTPQPLEVFLEEIAQSTQGIFILDPHFDEQVGIKGMWDYLVYSIAPVKIIVSKADSKKDLESWIRKHPDPKKAVRAIEVRKTDLEFHDRFAVIDSELWHFGSTVGGAQPQFSAATRGWSSSEFCMVFDRLWKDSK